MSEEKTKKVLVTGGCGFIGSHVCICLIEEGYDVVVFDSLVNSSQESLRRVEKLTNKTIAFEKIDLVQTSELDKGFEKHGPFICVIHLAALKALRESVEKPLKYYANNLGGVFSLVSVMEKHNCHSIVFSSSASVYGNPEKLPLTEDSPVSASNPYGRTKLVMEQILSDCTVANKKLSVVCLRYFNPIGAHSSGEIGESPQGTPNNLMPLILQVITGSRDHISVFGSDWDTKDGTGVRDYIHVMDCAEGHVAVLKNLSLSQGMKTYNLGTGNGVSVLELIHGVEAASGKKVAYEFVDRRPGDPASNYADPSLAEKELGWQAKRSVTQMCEDSWRWHSRNPNGYEKDN